MKMTRVVLGISALVASSVASRDVDAAICGDMPATCGCVNNKSCLTVVSGVGPTARAFDGVSVEGTAVFGSSAASWPNVGVRGENQGYGGTAMAGVATNTSTSYGIYGEGATIGVQGYANNWAGKGVQGVSNSAAGHGLDGYCGGSCASDTTGGFAIYANGRAGGTTNWISGSDARLKKEIQNLSYGIEQVLKLRPVTFKLKSGDQRTQLGLIAQEARKVIPEVVLGDESKGMLGLDYTALVPVLLKAVQEQQHMIQKQQAQIDELRQGRRPLASSVISDGAMVAVGIGVVPLGLLVAARRRKLRGQHSA